MKLHKQNLSLKKKKITLDYIMSKKGLTWWSKEIGTDQYLVNIQVDVKDDGQPVLVEPGLIFGNVRLAAEFVRQYYMTAQKKYKGYKMSKSVSVNM